METPPKQKNVKPVEESQEEFELDVTPTERFLRTEIKKRHESTKNRLAWLVTGTLCAAVIIFLFLSAFCQSEANAISDAFGKICFVLGPLVGLAFGTYYRKTDN